MSPRHVLGTRRRPDKQDIDGSSFTRKDPARWGLGARAHRQQLDLESGGQRRL